MAKKCPYCGSSDTHLSAAECAGVALATPFRLGAAIVGGFAAHVISPAAGHKAVEKIWEEMKPDVDYYVCDHCGKKF